MRLTGLSIYPVKSTAAISLPASRVTSRGLACDREWMLTDPSGGFLTGRDYPALVRVRATPTIEGLHLEAPGRPALAVRRVSFNQIRPTGVWSSRFEAFGGDTAADAWFSELLGLEARLLYIGAASRRRLRADPSVTFGFADGYPLLLLSAASVADLNGRLQRPVSERNFRPNLVIDGVAPFAEDAWKEIRIGEVNFEVMKPCERCVFTTIDPDRGEADPAREPLRTLGSYRRTPAGVLFGQNLVARGDGILRVGDPVRVVRWN